MKNLNFIQHKTLICDYTKFDDKFNDFIDEMNLLLSDRNMCVSNIKITHKSTIHYILIFIKYIPE